jgi:hypothetical protein
MGLSAGRQPTDWSACAKLAEGAKQKKNLFFGAWFRVFRRIPRLDSESLSSRARKMKIIFCGLAKAWDEAELRIRCKGDKG